MIDAFLKEANEWAQKHALKLWTWTHAVGYNTREQFLTDLTNYGNERLTRAITGLQRAIDATVAERRGPREDSKELAAEERALIQAKEIVEGYLNKVVTLETKE